MYLKLIPRESEQTKVINIECIGDNKLNKLFFFRCTGVSARVHGGVADTPDTPLFRAWFCVWPKLDFGTPPTVDITTAVLWTVAYANNKGIT